MKRGFWICLIALLCCIECVFAELIITEVMFKPNETQGTSTKGEWVEIFNSGNNSINLSGWFFADSMYNDTIECCSFLECNKESSLILEPNAYALIADQDTLLYDSSIIPENSLKLCVDDNSLGNGLSDTEDSVAVFSGNQIYKFSYSNLSTEKGKSIEKKDLYGEDSMDNWRESIIFGGTPGADNSASASQQQDANNSNQTNSSSENPNINTTSSSFNLSILRLLPNPTGLDTAEKPLGEFAEIMNLGKTAVELANFSLKNSRGYLVLIDRNNTLNSTLLQPNSTLLVYPRKGTGFMSNEEDEILLLGRDRSILDNFSYSEVIEGIALIKIEGVVQQDEADGTDSQNSDEHSRFEATILSMLDLGKDNAAKFGDTFRLKIRVFRGEERKSSMSIWIEDPKGVRLGKYTSFNINTAGANLTISLPVLINPNCNRKFPDGNYSVFLGWTSGYKKLDSISVEIKGQNKDFCSSKTAKENTAQETDENASENSTTKITSSLEYSLESYKSELSNNNPFSTFVKLKNNGNNLLDIRLYSYVYKGSRAYSGERTANEKVVSLEPGEDSTVALENTVSGATPGEYKLKVLITASGRKTPYDLTIPVEVIGETKNISESISVSSNEAKSVSSVKTECASVEEQVFSKVPITFYESSSEKAQDLVFYFLAAALCLMVVILAFFRLR